MEGTHSTGETESAGDIAVLLALLPATHKHGSALEEQSRKGRKWASGSKWCDNMGGIREEGSRYSNVSMSSKENSDGFIVEECKCKGTEVRTYGALNAKPKCLGVMDKS
jgi:hypothetical protein